MLGLGEGGRVQFRTAVGIQEAQDLGASGIALEFGRVTGTPETVEVEIADWTAIEKWIASQKGKVVVVDMWSLSCEPCRREFPNLVKLHTDKGTKVACLSVSTDYAGIKSKPPTFYQPKVLEFLTAQKATCKNILCSNESDLLFEKLDLASIPAVYVYGKDGKLAKDGMVFYRVVIADEAIPGGATHVWVNAVDGTVIKTEKELPRKRSSANQ